VSESRQSPSRTSPDERSRERSAAHPLPKPLLRGWSHAAAAVAALVTTVALVALSGADVARAVSMLIFGLSMILMYVVSAIYHIGRWRPETTRVLRALDHANIYVLIAGTFTPLCLNVLDGSFRTTMLAIVWSVAIAGVALSVFTEHLPRFVTAGLYIGMGWIGVVVVPAFARLMPWPAVAVLLLGGLLYTVGALVYALRRPDPYPRVFGFHEVFHLFVIGGSAAFTVTIWVWVLPFARDGLG
jgi:hemolysin III